MKILAALVIALGLGACAPSVPKSAITPTTAAVPAAAHGSPVICQREEQGEVIGYPAGSAPRSGFPRVPCPH